MKHIFSLFLHDLKNIRRAPSFLILLAGLAILPSFYAWFNLKSSWDPYSNTEHIKIAVINHDKGAEIEGKKINVGNTLVDSLKDNKKFGWQFTDSLEDANRKLELGEYYAYIHIPKDFSKDMTSIFHKKPKRAVLEYKVNQKINAIAPKMTNAGATAITEAMNEKFIDTATKALLKESNKVGVKLEDRLPLYHKVENAIFEAEAAIPDMERFRKAVIKIDEHQGDISKYADDFYALSKYKGKINDGAGKIIEANQHAADIEQAGNLILKINNNLPVIENALSKANTVEQKFPQINQAVSDGITATNEAQRIIANSQGIMPGVHDKINKAQTGTAALKSQAPSVEDIVSSETQPSDNKDKTPTTEGPSTEAPVKEKVPTLEKPDLIPAKEAIGSGLNAMQVLLNEQSKAGEEMMKQLSQFQSNGGSGNQVKENLKVYQNNINQQIKFNEEMIKILQEANELGYSDSDKASAEIKNCNSVLAAVLNDVAAAIESGDTSKLNADRIKNAANVLNQLAAYSNGPLKDILSNGLNRIDDNLDKIAGKLAQASEFANTVDSILAHAYDVTTEANQTLNNINQELPALEAKFHRINETAQANYPKFKSKIGEASAFVESDLPGVLSDLNKLASFAQNDLPGVMQKYENASLLMQQKLPEAQAGIHKLAEFARNDLPGIERDIKKAANKFREIDKKDTLGKLIKLLRNDLQDESDYIAEPIKLVEKDLFPIPNYGSASAPFYTALALWVGALLSGNLLTTELKDKSLQGKYSLREIYLGRMILFLLLGIAQAIIVVLGNLFILDAYAKHPFWNVIFAILVSIAFTIMVYTMVSMLGNVGKAIAIIIMVLQISGGGGTFPVQVTPKFFQDIHPFLPFTYAVDLLREAVGGIVPSLVTHNILILYILAIGTLIFGYIMKPRFEPIKKGFYARSKASNLVE